MCSTVPAKPLNNAQIGGAFFYTPLLKIAYAKTCTLPADLIPLLRQRGLAIADEQKTVNYLSNIGYYRLSAYLYPLLREPKSDHLYKEGATFDMALNMYRFDRKLRILLFNEIEKIEVALRSAMSNIISSELGDVFWITDAKNFSNAAIFTKTFSLIQSELGRTKEEFIAHFQSKYTNPYPPAWMVAEIIPMGVLYNIFSNLKSKSLRKKVASSFGLPLSAFTSWLLILSNLRNLCGHHVRLWNKEIPLVATDPLHHDFPWIDSSAIDMKRLYFRICTIKYLLFTVSPRNRFTQKLKSLLAEYPTIDIRAMGFPIDWHNEPLWS